MILSNSENAAGHMPPELTCSPRDFMDAVREMYGEWLEMLRRDDPSLKRLPDFESAMDYVEQNGIGPCKANDELTLRSEAGRNGGSVE